MSPPMMVISNRRTFSTSSPSQKPTKSPRPSVLNLGITKKFLFFTLKICLFSLVLVSCKQKNDEVESGALYLKRDDEHVLVQLPHVNYLDPNSRDDIKHNTQLLITRDLSRTHGFRFKGQAPLSKSSVTLIKPASLHYSPIRSDPNLGANINNDILNFCNKLNDSFIDAGFPEHEKAQCEHVPWKIRHLRPHNPHPNNIPSPNHKVSLEYLNPIFEKLIFNRAAPLRNIGDFDPPHGISPKSDFSSHHNLFSDLEGHLTLIKKKDNLNISKDDVIAERSLIEKKFKINDPLFKNQWHLFNTDEPENDLRVSSVWNEGIIGENVNIAIVDDGVDFTHPDLVDAYFKEGSIDLTQNPTNIHTSYPNGLRSFFDHTLLRRASTHAALAHGTRCAGEIAARINNVCGVGIAFGSKIASIQLISLDSRVTDINEASAVSYRTDKNHIFACSWGPSDDGMTVEAPGSLTFNAIEDSIKTGRSGLGTIYVFASGNGGRVGDDCNYDGYVNDIRTITIASIDRHDTHARYSEECPANLAVTYSSFLGTQSGIVTSDVGGGCNVQTGTSASAPIGAALFSMALQVRPDLGYRDFQQLTILSAIPVDLPNNSWVKNDSGLLYSNKYGYGKLTADRTVGVAKLLDKLRPLKSLTVPNSTLLSSYVRINSPYKPTIVKFTVTDDMLRDARIASLEHVTISISLTYEVRGMLEYYLISPNDTHSKIAAARPYDTNSNGLRSWTFSTSAFWGESPRGEWKFVVAPIVLPDSYYSPKPLRYFFSNLSPVKGTLDDLNITFWGEEGTNLDDSTFRRNMRKVWDKYPYDYKIEKNDSDYNPYIFDEKVYRGGYKSKSSEVFSKKYKYILIVLIIAFNLALLLSYLYHRYRSNKRDTQITRRFLANSGNVGPSHGAPMTRSVPPPDGPGGNSGFYPNFSFHGLNLLPQQNVSYQPLKNNTPYYVNTPQAPPPTIRYSSIQPTYQTGRYHPGFLYQSLRTDNDDNDDNVVFPINRSSDNVPIAMTTSSHVPTNITTDENKEEGTTTSPD